MEAPANENTMLHKSNAPPATNRFQRETCRTPVAAPMKSRLQADISSVEEAKARLESLRLCGKTAFAFSFKHPFPAPNAQDEELPQFFTTFQGPTNSSL